MIKNEKQLQVAKSRLKAFSEAILQVENNNDVDPLFKELQLNALKSQISDFEEEIKSYMTLKTGNINQLEVEFEHIPDALISMRILKGWSQAELAREVELKEQQIQRYEASQYAAASFARITSIANAMDLNISNIRIKVKENRIVIPGMDEGVLMRAQERLKERKSLIL